jgi:uncharacterized protein DUF6839
MTTVRDLDNDKYNLVQTDYDVKDTLESIGLEKQDWQYLIVELESNQAEYKRVWGLDSCNLDSTAYLIYTTQFNKSDKQ